MTQRGRDVEPRRARTIARRSCAGPSARRRRRGRRKSGKPRVRSASVGVPRAPRAAARVGDADAARRRGDPRRRARRRERAARRRAAAASARAGRAPRRRRRRARRPTWPPPRRRRVRRRPRAQHRDLLRPHRPLARRRPRARDRRRRLLRHAAGRVGLHARLPGPEPDPRARRRRGALVGVRARSSPSCWSRSAGARRSTPRARSPGCCCSCSPIADAAVHPRRAVADAAVHRTRPRSTT